MEELKKIAVKWPYFFIILIFVWGSWDGSLNAMWMERFSLIMILCAVYFSCKVGREYGWPLFVITCSTLVSAIINFSWFDKYQGFPFEFQSVIRQSAAMGLALFLLPLIFFIQIRKSTFNRICIGLVWSGLITSVMLLLSYYFHPSGVSYALPFFDNASMAASFVVACLFISRGPIAWGLGIWAVVAVGASTPMVMLLGGGVAYGLLHKDINVRMTVLWLCIFLPVIVLILYPVSELINSTGRLELWELVMTWWFREGSLVFGHGVGSLRVLLPLIQDEYGTGLFKDKLIFFWMHNDWLQVLFEQGLVGLVGLVMGYVYLLKLTIKDVPVFCALIAYGLMMLTNFPLHMPMHVLLGFVLVRLAMYGKMRPT